MEKAFDYRVQDQNFFEFAIKLILGVILTPLFILLMPFYDSFHTN